MASLGPVTRETLAHIVPRLRAADEKEIFSLRWNCDDGTLDRDRFVEDIAAMPGLAWTAHARDGEPVAVIGARPLWPGVWGAYAFGTDRWREVALTLTKVALRRMAPTLIEDMGAHLAFCYAQADHTQARAWLERIGFKAEFTVPQMGRDRSDYVFHARRA